MRSQNVVAYFFRTAKLSEKIDLLLYMFRTFMYGLGVGMLMYLGCWLFLGLAKFLAAAVGFGLVVSGVFLLISALECYQMVASHSSPVVAGVMSASSLLWCLVAALLFNQAMFGMPLVITALIAVPVCSMLVDIVMLINDKWSHAKISFSAAELDALERLNAGLPAVAQPGTGLAMVHVNDAAAVPTLGPSS